MHTYKNKPKVIEAFQMTQEHIDSDAEWPNWLKASMAQNNAENNSLVVVARIPREYAINTLEGVMQVSVNDYIIKGIQGELYPCKPDIFEASYEKVI